MRHPALRYQTAREIITDLDAAIGPVFPKQRGEGWSAKHAGLIRAIAAGAAAMALTGAGVYYFPQFRERFFPIPVAKVALVPFVPAGSQEDLRYQAQGINDSLAAKLSPITSIRLLPRHGRRLCEPKQGL